MDRIQCPDEIPAALSGHQNACRLPLYQDSSYVIQMTGFF